MTYKEGDVVIFTNGESKTIKEVRHIITEIVFEDNTSHLYNDFGETSTKDFIIKEIKNDRSN